MALDKLVDSTQLDSDLTSVANAIRTKGGTSGSLAFPAGFVSAIDAIETGGGVQFKAGTYTPASSVQNIAVSVDFDPQYALIFTNPLELEQTNSWKETLVFYDRVSGVAYSVQTRYNNSDYYSNPGIRLDSGTYAGGTFTFNRASNYSFLAGVSYTWVCWREEAE